MSRAEDGAAPEIPAQLWVDLLPPVSRSERGRPPGTSPVQLRRDALVRALRVERNLSHWAAARVAVELTSPGLVRWEEDAGRFDGEVKTTLRRAKKAGRYSDHAYTSEEVEAMYSDGALAAGVLLSRTEMVRQWLLGILEDRGWPAWSVQKLSEYAVRDRGDLISAPALGEVIEDAHRAIKGPFRGLLGVPV